MEKEADVVIIGGGISGCATAYNLAKRGKRVVVVEKEKDVALEASGRNSASVGLLGKHGPELPLMAVCMKMWDGLDHELGCETDFVKKGRMNVAFTEEELHTLENGVHEAKEYGVEVKMLTPKEARSIVPAIEGPLIGAAFSLEDGHADPVKVTVGFANAAREHGAKLHTSCTAIGIETSGGRVSSVVTTLGEIRAPIVVNAAGVWTPRLLKTLRIHMPVKILRSTSAMTDPVSPLTRVYVRGSNTSCKQTAGGNLRVAGGYRTLFQYDMAPDALEELGVWLPRFLRLRKSIRLNLDWPHLVREIKRTRPFRSGITPSLDFPTGLEPPANQNFVRARLQALYRLMPSLREKNLKITKAWGGLLDMTPDLLSVMGEVERPRGLIVAAGFSGHGFGLGPLTGKLLSELILDGKPSLPIKAFRLARFVEEKIPIPTRAI
ncbi:MAG: FAD-binding oxidoreductase [Chloroflexi bacterium]|nr:FAD-binding oxidoreductase [Chloroflexota bacterium]